MTDQLLAPLRLVLGDEELLVSRAVAEVVAAAKATGPDVDVRDASVGQLEASSIGELLSPSLFGGRRVVVVRDAQNAVKDVVAVLLAYAADPADEVSLVVTHSGGGRAKALADGLAKAGAVVVSCAKVAKHRERLAFVKQEVTRCGGRIGEAAAEEVLATIGNNLRELASVCAQLTSDTGGRIDSSAVRRYHSGRAEVSGFTVADAAMVGDVAGGIEALRWAVGIGVDPVLIADALADGIRSVAKVAAAGKGNPFQLSNRLGMPPWKIERAQRQAKGWSPAGLAAAMAIAAEANAAVKGAAWDRTYAVEKAVLNIAAARALR